MWKIKTKNKTKIILPILFTVNKIFVDALVFVHDVKTSDMRTKMLNYEFCWSLCGELRVSEHSGFEALSWGIVCLLCPWAPRYLIG